MQAWDAVNNYRGGSLWAAGWAAYLSFFRDVCGWSDPVLEHFEIDEALMKSCGWVWWHENVLAISDRPTVINRDKQGRLHSEVGPSIAYRDGWQLHHWHGTSVPAEWIEKRADLSPNTVIKAQNVEQRAAGAAIVGWPKMLSVLKSKTVNKHANPNIGELIELTLPGLDEPKERVRELSDSEEEKLFANVRPGYRSILRFAVLSALRRNELLAMHWEHVDWGGRRLNLMGKGEVIGFIPLSTEMERVLRSVIPEGETSPAGPVWLYRPARHEEGADNLTPRPITHEGLKTEFRRARKNAGMKSSHQDPLMGYRFHNNRHTGITRLVRDSGNLKLGQKLGRHASIATTMKYAHATEDDLRKALDAVHSSRESSQIDNEALENTKEIKRIV